LYQNNENSDRLTYDSYMSGSQGVDLRNLEVDVPLVLTADIMNRILLNSRDVIHRFAVPQLGFKLDCVPGRLNLRYLRSFHFGKFYGQCSEICGANHSFMPVVMECVPAPIVIDIIVEITVIELDGDANFSVCAWLIKTFRFLLPFIDD